jgi:hypothetical protein
LRALDLQCRAAAAKREVIADNSISPFDLIWDIDGGTTSSGVKQSTELVIFVTPNITRSSVTPRGRVLSCEETFSRAGNVVNFLPKVKVELVVDDYKGNTYTETLELDAETQSAIRNYDYLDGGFSRYLQRVKVSAWGSPCFDLQATLSTVDVESGDTLAEMQLPVVVTKALPQRIVRELEDD